MQIDDESLDSVEYGKHVWISSDTNVNEDEGLIVAIASLTELNPIKGKIEFYRIIPVFGSFRKSKPFKLATEIDVADEIVLSSASFVNGSFVWQNGPNEAPSLLKACASN